MRTIIIGLLLVFIPFGIRSGMGLFVSPIASQRGWEVGDFAFTLAIQFLMFGVFSPFAGYLSDRFGGVRVFAFGGLLFSGSFFVGAFVQPVWLMHLVCGVLMGIGIACTSLGIMLPIIAQATTPAKRSAMLGFGTGFAAMGQFVFPPLQDWLLRFGVTIAFQVMGVLLFVIPLLALFLKTTNKQTTKSKQQNQNVKNEKVEQKANFGELKQLLRTASLWWLSLGFASCGFYVAFIGIHIPHFLQVKGFSASLGATVLSIIGLFNMLGSYFAGVLGGRYSKRYLLVWLYSLRFVFISAFLLLPLSTASILIFSSLAGILWLSTIPLTMGLITHLYTFRYTATLYGLVFLFHQIGGFLGIFLGAQSFKLFNGYEFAWWAMAIFSLISAMMHVPVKEKLLLDGSFHEQKRQRKSLA